MHELSVIGAQRESACLYRLAIRASEHVPRSVIHGTRLMLLTIEKIFNENLSPLEMYGTVVVGLCITGKLIDLRLGMHRPDHVHLQLNAN